MIRGLRTRGLQRPPGRDPTQQSSRYLTRKKGSEKVDPQVGSEDRLPSMAPGELKD